MCPTGTSTAVLRRDEAAARGSDLRPAFDVIDADRDGKISKDDLRAFYAGFSGSGASEEDMIGSMMTVADANEDGDGDGLVGFEDLQRYLKWAGFETGDEDIRAMIRLGGGDENRGVTFDGLLKILAV
ncbi:Ca2+-binding protein 1 [Actinidia rufa]|uniref:Ca2+-binding protein 1 n=1 Tax=Actinidia rufa TaxID=165716 RepID=A0A7J0GL04_9ERIC|nr:Ca2+-binding protein 1 [Actinidia rufa]